MGQGQSLPHGSRVDPDSSSVLGSIAAAAVSSKVAEKSSAVFSMTGSNNLEIGALDPNFDTTLGSQDHCRTYIGRLTKADTRNLRQGTRTPNNASVSFLDIINKPTFIRVMLLTDPISTQMRSSGEAT